MFRVPDTGPRTQPRRSKVKDYVPNENDKAFRSWLDIWRRETSEAAHGKPCVRYLGSSNIMLDDTFEKICDAVHHNLINSVHDLHKETSRWNLTHKYGQIIVDSIKNIIPAVPPPTATTTTAKQRRCSSCSQVGHTSGFPFGGLQSCHMSVTPKLQNAHNIARQICRVQSLVILQVSCFVSTLVHQSYVRLRRITLECDLAMLRTVPVGNFIQE